MSWCHTRHLVKCCPSNSRLIKLSSKLSVTSWEASAETDMEKQNRTETEEKPPPYSASPNFPQLASTHAFNPNNPNYVPPPPPPGFQPYPPQMAPGPITSYGSMPLPQHTVVITTSPATDNIIIVGGCPACRIGVLEDDFTCLGIFCAIFCFPVGILCCLALKDKRCTNCGAYFG